MPDVWSEGCAQGAPGRHDGGRLLPVGGLRLRACDLHACCQQPIVTTRTEVADAFHRGRCGGNVENLALLREGLCPWCHDPMESVEDEWVGPYGFCACCGARLALRGDEVQVVIVADTSGLTLSLLRLASRSASTSDGGA